ncbi:MAG: S8 family serine peptidase, partial [Chloroflexi bacterium]|nr:S8 family serine peptidase [Chloroflexota bacterium]
RLDTALDMFAALSLGIFAGLLLDVFWFRLSAPDSGGALIFHGLVVGIVLLILGSGFGFDGSQLLLMVALPPLGFALAALGRASNARAAWLPLAACIALAAAAPLSLFDPDELSIILGNDEILSWAQRAVWLSWFIALFVGTALWLLRERLLAPRAAVVLPLFALTSLGGVLTVALLGHPGFYGEQLFVILRDQADLSRADSIADRDERTRYVYTTLTQHANRTQANLRAYLDRMHVGYVPYYLVNSIEVNGGALTRMYLSSQPEVDRVLDSPHLRPLPVPPPISTGNERAPSAPPWNINSIGADRVWNELHVTGKGIVVGQSDSGVQGDHPALRDGYRGRSGGDDFNWLDPWNSSAAPNDLMGHGTHTLGSILGRGGVGVAPDAEWFACVNLARNLGNPPLY